MKDTKTAGAPAEVVKVTGTGPGKKYPRLNLSREFEAMIGKYFLVKKETGGEYRLVPMK